MNKTLKDDAERMEEIMCKTADRCDIWQDRFVYWIAVAIYHLIQRINRLEMEESKGGKPLTIIAIILAIISITMGLVPALYREEGHTAIVIDKYEINGLHIIEIAVPIDESLYVGLDVGDEVTLENE